MYILYIHMYHVSLNSFYAQVHRIYQIFSPSVGLPFLGGTQYSVLEDDL